MEERDGGLPTGGDGGGGGRRASAAPGEEWSPEGHPRGWEVVAMGRGSSLYEDDFFVFPPSDHEGLLVEQAPMAAAEGRPAAVASPRSSPPSLSSAGNGGESRWPVRCQLQREGERWPLVGLARRAFDSGIELLWFKLPRSSVGAVPARMKGGAIWSFAAVAGLTALLLYSHHRSRREKLRLLLLIREKDQSMPPISLRPEIIPLAALQRMGFSVELGRQNHLLGSSLEKIVSSLMLFISHLPQISITITWLSQHIAQMNELMAARMTVPVARSA